MSSTANAAKAATAERRRKATSTADDEHTTEEADDDHNPRPSILSEAVLADICDQLRETRDILATHSRVLQGLMQKSARKRKDSSSSDDDDEDTEAQSDRTTTATSTASSLAESKGFASIKVLQTPKVYQYIPEKLFSEVHLRTALRDRYPVAENDQSFTGHLQKTFRELLVKATFGTVEEVQQTIVDQLERCLLFQRGIDVAYIERLAAETSAGEVASRYKKYAKAYKKAPKKEVK